MVIAQPLGVLPLCAKPSLLTKQFQSVLPLVFRTMLPSPDSKPLGLPGYRHRRYGDAGGGTAERRLTSREWEVLELLAQRRSTAEIARRLVLSPSAVRVHIASIVRKLDVTDRAAAAELFGRSGT